MVPDLSHTNFFSCLLWFLDPVWGRWLFQGCPTDLWFDEGRPSILPTLCTWFCLVCLFRFVHSICVSLALVLCYCLYALLVAFLLSLDALWRVWGNRSKEGQLGIGIGIVVGTWHSCKQQKHTRQARQGKRRQKKGGTHDDGVRYAKQRLIVLVCSIFPLLRPPLHLLLRYTQNQHNHKKTPRNSLVRWQSCRKRAPICRLHSFTNQDCNSGWTTRLSSSRARLFLSCRCWLRSSIWLSERWWRSTLRWFMTSTRTLWTWRLCGARRCLRRRVRWAWAVADRLRRLTGCHCASTRKPLRWR